MNLAYFYGLYTNVSGVLSISLRQNYWDDIDLTKSDYHRQISLVGAMKSCFRLPRKQERLRSASKLL